MTRKRPARSVAPEALECRKLLTTIEVSPGDSIQAAIDSASSGDTIQINEGIYDEQIQVLDINLKLVGVGDVKITGRNFAGTRRPGLSAFGMKSLLVENIDFPMHDIGISIAAVGKTVIRDVDASGSGLTFGFTIEDANKVTLERVTANSNALDGLDVFDVKSLTVRDSTFEGNGGAGIDLFDVGKAKIDQTNSTFNDEDGLFAANMNVLQISNGEFSDNGGGLGDHGIEVANIARQVKVRNVTAEFNTDTGLEVGQDSLVGKAVVLDSVFSENDQNGMDFNNLKTIVVNRSTANDNGDDGLDVDTARKVTVKSSEFARNGDDGIDIFNATFRQSNVNAFDNADEDIVNL